MKKKSLWAKAILLAGVSVLWSACNNSDDIPNKGDEDGVAKGKVQFTVQFGQDPAPRATKSTAIPNTSWNNINQIQFLLVDATTGAVKYAETTNPAAGGTASAKTYTYSDVPVGSYTLHVIANAGQNNIDPYFDGNNGVWNSYNVRQKQLNTLFLKHKAGAFPSFAQTAQTTAGNSAFVEPAEIFYATSTSVAITDGATTTLPSISLKRKVSLMRVRVNYDDSEAGVNNTPTAADGVDWTKDASIMIYRLPEQIGANGVVSTTSNAKHVLTIFDGTNGANTFKTADPTTGYGPANGKILTDNFKLWRDIVVFPNGTTSGQAPSANQYFIVISAQGKTGHELADGTKLTAPTTVYWSGVIKDNLIPNQIREVNLTLKSGGTIDIPTEPRLEGGLKIELGAPEPWDSNIVQTDIPL